MIQKKKCNTRVTNGKNSRRPRKSKGSSNINGRPPDQSVCIDKSNETPILNSKFLTVRSPNQIDAPIVASAAVADPVFVQKFIKALMDKNLSPKQLRKKRRNDGKRKTKCRKAQRKDKRNRLYTD